jgi:hypothetical protein
LIIDKLREIKGHNISSGELPTKEELFNELVNSYTYPINYDKKSLNNIFLKILYYIILFSDNINKVQMNQKLKNIILFLIKFHKALNNNDYDIINTNKIYSDIIIFQIIKILIFNNMNDIFINIEHIKKKFIQNIIIINIINNLSWRNLSKQLFYLKYIIDIKDSSKEIIISENKINKMYTYNLDNRIKKIILDPLIMLNYLRREYDFYKWLLIFNTMYNKIFYNMIVLKNEELLQLSKILYYYSKIKNQNSEDKYYNKFLFYVKNNTKLILFNDRINIRFKDIFKNININLGFMARDIINDEEISITVSDEEENKINKLKKKYYKYKGKYLEIKTSETHNITAD